MQKEGIRISPISVPVRAEFSGGPLEVKGALRLLPPEEEKFEIFYAKEADQVRFVAEFKMATNIAFPDEIVKFILA